MSNVDHLRRLIALQEQRLRNLTNQGIRSDGDKIATVQERIDELKAELRSLEGSPDTQGSVQEVPSPFVSAEELVKRVRRSNQKVLSKHYGPRYSTRCYAQRASLAGYFSDFMSGECTVMVVTGKAGMGKSVFVCSLAQAPPPDTLVWLQDCADLQIDSDADIDDYVGHRLGLTSGVLGHMESFLDENPSSAVLLIFDSINEFPERKDLLSQLSELAAAIHGSRIKLLLTCRVPMWHSIDRYLSTPADWVFHTAGPGSYVNLGPFNQEEVKQAYEGYRKAYQTKTPFDELEAQVEHFISHPLFLRMVAEVYREREIPKRLALRDVFAEYIRICLGEAGFESEEFAVLQRIIELMYKQARRELEEAILEENGEIGHYLIPNLDSPYYRLIDEGLLSQKLQRSIVRAVKVIFVTYERVFEYLLAEIVIGEVTITEIVRNLDLARARSFAQLRGATELALSFSLLSGATDESLIMELAQLGRPDSRRFLCDVIQTIFDSGHRQMAEELVFAISRDETAEAKLLAAQAAYELRFDDILVSLSVSEDSELRDLAAWYIYERWNCARQEERLGYGYELLNRLKSRVNLLKLRKSGHALRTLMSVTANMFTNIVEDPESVYPVVDVYREFLDRIPGFDTSNPQRAFGNWILPTSRDAIIGVGYWAITHITTWDVLMQDAVGNPRTARAALDVGQMLSLRSLVDYKREIIELMTWDSMFVRFISSSLTVHQVYCNPDEHFPLFLEMLDSPRLELVHRLWLLRAIVLGAVSRTLNQQTVPGNLLGLLTDHLVALRYEVFDGPQHQSVSGPGEQSGTERPMPEDPVRLWEDVLIGILIIEATAQRERGGSQASQIARKLIDVPTFAETRELTVLIDALGKVAYQGFVDFAVLSILDRKTRLLWTKKASDIGIETIKSIRALHQQQVDSLLDDREDVKKVWDRVRMEGGYPTFWDTRIISTELWTMVAIATDVQLAKVAGLYLMELAFSDSVEECFRGMVQLSMELLSDPIRVDIAHVQWGLAHDPEWDRFEELEIQRDIVDKRPELHEYYGKRCREYVENHGRGILYSELR